MHALSYKSLMVRYTPGLPSVRRRRLEEVSTENIQTCHSLAGLRHTLPIPSKDAYIYLIQVGSLGWISRRCVG